MLETALISQGVFERYEIYDLDFRSKFIPGGPYDIARKMKAKFDKYWGNIEKMNMMLYIVVMLNPRHKFSYLRNVFKNVHEPEIGEKMGDLARSALYDVFEEYKKIYSSATSRPSTTSSGESSQELDDDIERRPVRDKKKK
ncbi:hypothetical protein Sango_1884000 [Sesamum angolense]|uniref:hAT-like transposase RNase-H fold domain-containing protein n=1 Tax=Sesamum angolense TaxID=2727404 RepID=A0AAE1WIS1_9LAMI|nr:hypothetical protein Sango_1884000 [Sesamum angolense]